MSTTVINSSIPAGQFVTGIFTASQPYRGIEILMSQTFLAGAEINPVLSAAGDDRRNSVAGDPSVESVQLTLYMGGS